MNFLKRIFGGSTENAQRDPETEKLISEISRIADETIEIRYAGGSVVTSSTVDLGQETELTKAADRLLERNPENPEFLFAKAEAHYARMDGETGEAYRKMVLDRDPDHFDAKMRGRYFEQWDGLFSCPGWDGETTIVPSVMLDLQNDGQAIQSIRDGIRRSIAVLLPASRDGFPNNITASKWKPVWFDTPHGPVFEHYVMLQLSDGSIRRQELCVNPYPIEPPHPRHGNWLLHRLATLDSIFIAFNDGADVIYNQRFIFDRATVRALQQVASKIDKLVWDSKASEKFVAAAQWYMQNSDLDDIAW